MIKPDQAGKRYRARDLAARQVVAEPGEISDEWLKWKVTRRMYASDTAARAIIDQRLHWILTLNW